MTGETASNISRPPCRSQFRSVLHFRPRSTVAEFRMPIIDNEVLPDFEPPASDLEPMSMGEWIYNELESNISKYGDSTWMTDASTDNTMTYTELRNSIKKIGSALRKKGLRSGDSVLFMTGNYIEVAVAFLATLRAGGVPNVMTLNILPEDILLRCNQTEPKFVFVDEPRAPRIFETLKNCTYVQEMIVFGEHEACTSVDILLQDDGQAFPEKIEMDPYSRAFILYSSGTTGFPKAILLDHFMLRKNSLFKKEHNGGGGETGRKCLFINSVTVPTGIINIITGIFSYCHSIILSDCTDEKLLEAIDKTKPVQVSAFASQIVWICKHPNLGKYDLSSVRAMFIAGTNISPFYEREIYSKLPNLLYVFTVYGMTETGAVTANATFFNKDMDKRSRGHVFGSCGKLLPYCRLKILNDDGEKLGPGQVGHVVYKTPTYMIGYLNNPEATAQLIQGGWCFSGDLGYYDEDGFIYITGRHKELIKCKNGAHVVPANIEKHLLTHPAVADAIVVGKPDDLEGQIPLAAVVKQPGHDVTERELVEMIDKLVQEEERLRGGVRFVDQIPRNLLGKPLRHVVLKEVLEKRLAATT